MNHLDAAIIPAEGKLEVVDTIALLNVIEQSRRILSENRCLIKITDDTAKEAVRLGRHRRILSSREIEILFAHPLV
jgi:hypothetical protein